MARPLALLLVLALVLAGCNGGDDDAREAAPGQTTTETESAGAGARDVFGEIPAIVREVELTIVSVLVESARGAGEGSGVIWSEDGLIVTNDHVVRGAGEVQVVLASGERLDAEARASDPLTDIAVLHVERTGLPTAQFAEPLPQPGELAVAMGNPLGFENTVTEGIVSGLHRSIPSGGQTPALVDLIQTSAPISPGNSGGALVDADRRVIGINVAYLPPGTGAVALGFAIPARTVTSVVSELLEDGEVNHAFLGVQAGAISPQIADRFGLPSDEGALVLSVVEGTAAAQAGLEPGDVIVELGGQRLETVEDLLAKLRTSDPGDELTLVALRDGDRVELTVTLSERPDA